MAHDDQFTATGPPLSGSGFPRSAFSSRAAGMVYGAERPRRPSRRLRRERAGCDHPRVRSEGVGVCGVGDNFGVFGRTHPSPGRPGIAGVYAQHNRGGVGAIGATMRGGTGIIGTSVSSLGNPLATFASGTGPGDGSGTGVFGSSGSGVGVIGVSQSAEGIRGESADGDAVFGRSRAGRGGRFQSGVSAGGSMVGQVGLVPQRMPLPRRVPVSPSIYDLRVREVLPPEGRGGDLLVTEGEDGTCALWFCTNSAEPERRAVWREVLLGPTSVGPPELVDWREAVSDQGAVGIWRGGAVRLRGPLGTGHALLGEFPGFSTADFTPPVPATDAIELVGAPGHQFQIEFDVPIQDPVLHLASLGSEIVFAGGVEPVVLSGHDVTAVGNTLTGNLSPDADCSIRLDGRFTAISFVATVLPPAPVDGFFLQIGGFPG